MTRRVPELAACLAPLLLLPAATAAAEDTIECYMFAFCFQNPSDQDPDPTDSEEDCETYIYKYTKLADGKPDCGAYLSFRTVRGNNPGTCESCDSPLAAGGDDGSGGGGGGGGGGGIEGGDAAGGPDEPLPPIEDYGLLDLTNHEITFQGKLDSARIKSVSVEAWRSPELLVNGQVRRGWPLALYTIEFYTGQRQGEGPAVLTARFARQLPPDWAAIYPQVSLKQLPGAEDGKQLFQRVEQADRPQYYAKLEGAFGGGPQDIVYIRTKRNVFPKDAVVPGVKPPDDGGVDPDPVRPNPAPPGPQQR